MFSPGISPSVVASILSTPGTPGAHEEVERVTFDKAVIHELRMPYAVGVMGPGASPGVAVATEDHGPAVAIAPPYREARPLAPGPGGCMALVHDPEVPAHLYAIMGCFVGYRFQGAGIYRLQAGREAQRVADLPFAHRIGLARRGGRRLLLAASLAEDKADAADWSRPGALHAAELEAGSDGRLELAPVVTGLHKNHGFLLAELEGRSTLLLGTQEGLLAVDLEASGTDWPVRQVLGGETSEMALLDLDGDGRPALVTIEPFHGNALRAYRRAAGGWSLFFEAELQFGHCVLAGPVAGRPSVLVSNRAGDKDLLLFAFDGAAAPPRRVVVDHGAAAANMVLLSHDGKDRILSANQAAGQIVMYTPRA
jgi:hypothetical protein